MSDIIQFSIQNNNVIINWNKFWDYTRMCIEKNIGQDINNIFITSLYNDSEVAYDALRSFFVNSFKQLKQQFKVTFIDNNDNIKIEFGNYDKFVSWINDYLLGKNGDFIKRSIIAELL
jgi:hypothetical protein